MSLFMSCVWVGGALAVVGLTALLLAVFYRLFRKLTGI